MNETNYVNEVICTVDALLFAMTPDYELSVLLPKRNTEPFKGVAAIPGVYIRPEIDVSAEEAAKRALREKAGVEPHYLEQLKTFTGPHRDPRGWSISITYFALVPWSTVENAVDSMVGCDKLPTLPFDHSLIVQTALERIRGKAGYSNLPLNFLGRFFTLAEMRLMYEALIGRAFPRTTFRRWAESAIASGVIRETQHTRNRLGRPAKVFENMFYGPSSDKLVFFPSIVD